MSQEKDFSELSDDEVMNLGPDAIAAMAAADDAAAAEAAQGAPAADPASPENEEEQEEEDEQEQEEEQEEEEEETQPELDAQGNPVPATEPEEDAQGEPEAPAAKPTKEKKPKPSAEAEFDVEGAKKLFAPFKAGGKEFNIRSAEEGVRLMQLGVGFNAKMAELKPKLAILRTLERNELLDEGKLNFLIDLSKKNPEAIAKLVKDSGVDLHELDEDKVSGYKANDYSTSTKEVELDEAFDSLKHSDHYPRLIKEVSNTWDAASRRELGSNPGVVNLIHDHMAAGFYDKIVAEYDRRVALGTVPASTPFLAAYSQIGDQLNAAGAFGQQEATPAKKLVTPGKEKARGARQADEARRRAAAPAPTKGSPKAKPPVQDVWNMSDADFAKLNIR